MIEMIEKTQWDNVRIIDLPYKPFDKEDKTERGVVDHIANEIIRLSKSEKRKVPASTISKDFNFYKAKTIVAIDVSCIEDAQRSYIENLNLLTRIYPFIMINCNLSKEALYNLGFHRELREKGYILPVFRRIAANDILSTGKRYGDKIDGLLSGKYRDINKNEIINIPDLYSVDDIEKRFPGLFFNGNKAMFKTQIFWLGVADEKINEVLNELFNSDDGEFNVKEMCDKYDIARSEIEKYIESSMLFNVGENKEVKMRFLRNKILLPIMKTLSDQFEWEMINRRCIDTTHSDYAEYNGRFLEYHSVGNLFNRKDNFAFKLLSYIRTCFNGLQYNKVVLVDNGKEGNLYELITHIFVGVKVTRIINYFNEPVVYPFDRISENDKVVVLVDIINTGKFMSRVIELLDQKINCVINGCFSFIIDIKLNIPFIFSKIKHKYNTKFFYYIEKSLHCVENIRSDEQKERFTNNREELFLIFWQTINNLCDVSDEVSIFPTRFNSKLYGKTDISIFYTKSFNLKPNTSISIFSESYLMIFFNWLIKKNEFTIIIIPDEEQEKKFIGNIEKNEKNMPTFIIKNNTKKKIIRKALKSHKRILIFNMTMNFGININKLIDRIKTNSDEDAEIVVFTFLSRKNVIAKTEYLYQDIRKEIVQNIDQLYCFYNSDIPFYLINKEKENDTYYKKLFKYIS